LAARQVLAHAETAAVGREIHGRRRMPFTLRAIADGQETRFARGDAPIAAARGGDVAHFRVGRVPEGTAEDRLERPPAANEAADVLESSPHVKASRTVLILLALAAAACGGGGGNPVGPTPVPGTPVSGFVFYDENANGVLDPTELVRLPAVSVTAAGKTA